MSFFTLSFVCDHGHDASMSLFQDDKLIYFVPFERSLRIKKSILFDKNVIDFIYKNITKKIDLFVYKSGINFNKSVLKYFSEKFKDSKVFIENEKRKHQSLLKNKTNFNLFSHHCSHAISSFYMSPFDEAVCLVIDGEGTAFFFEPSYDHLTNPPNYKIILRACETASIIEIDKHFNRKNIYKRLNYAVPHLTSLINRSGVFSTALQIGNPYEHLNLDQYPFKIDLTSHLDIGKMYEVIAESTELTEGKVMGLSAYGNPTNSLPPFFVENTLLSNMNLFSLGSGNRVNKELYPHLYQQEDFQTKADMSYEVQKCCEKIFLKHAQYIKENCAIRNLVISGGCALNILAISAIKKEFPEFNIFVDPIATDACHSISYGLQHYYYYNKEIERVKKLNSFDTIYTGFKYSDEEILKSVDEFLESKTK